MCVQSTVLTFAFELFFLDAGLLEPLPLLKPIFSSDSTRCCSSSDKDCTDAQEGKKRPLENSLTAKCLKQKQEE